MFSLIHVSFHFSHRVSNNRLSRHSLWLPMVPLSQNYHWHQALRYYIVTCGGRKWLAVIVVVYDYINSNKGFYSDGGR